MSFVPWSENLTSFFSKEQQTCKYYASYFILTSFLRSNKDSRVLQVCDREHDGEQEWEKWMKPFRHIYIHMYNHIYILIIVNTHYLEWKKPENLLYACFVIQILSLFSLSLSLFHIHISFSVWSFKSCDCSCQKILHERKNYCVFLSFLFLMSFSFLGLSILVYFFQFFLP